MKGNTEALASKAKKTDGSNVFHGFDVDVKALDEQEQGIEDTMLLLASKSNSRYATVTRQVQLQATTHPVRLVYACVQLLLSFDKKLLWDCLYNSQCEFEVQKKHECSYQIRDLLPQPPTQSLDQRSPKSKRVPIPKSVIRSLYFDFWACSETINNEQKKTNNLSDDKEALTWDCNEIWQDFFKRGSVNPSVCAAILWHHLRYIPEPIFPYDVYDKIMSLMQNEDFEQNREEDHCHVYGIVPLTYLKHITKMLSVQRRHSLFQFLRLAIEFLELEMDQGQQPNKDEFKDVSYEEDIDDDGEYKKLQEYFQLDGSIAVIIANIAAPMLLRPQGVAYMSPLHRQNLSHARMLILQYIYNFKSLSDILSSTSSPTQEPLEHMIASNAKASLPSFTMNANKLDDIKEIYPKAHSESKTTCPGCLPYNMCARVPVSQLGTKSYSNLQGNEKLAETKNTLPFVCSLIQTTVKDILRSSVNTNVNSFDHLLTGFINADNFIATDNMNLPGEVVIDNANAVGAIASGNSDVQHESKRNYTYNNTIQGNTNIDKKVYVAEAHEKALFEMGIRDIQTECNNASSSLNDDKNTTDEDELEETESGPASPETTDDLEDLFLEKPKIVTIDNVLNTQPSCAYRNEELNLNKKQRKQHRRKPITPSIVPSTTWDSDMPLQQNNCDLHKSRSESDLKSRSSIAEASQKSMNLLESRIELALRGTNNSTSMSEQSQNKTRVDLRKLLKRDQMVLEHGLSGNHITLKDKNEQEREFPSVEISTKESKEPNVKKDLGFGSKQKLELEKKQLKKRLKLFDIEFERIHGRRPTRIEKEPIRHIYEAYNAIKILLNNNNGISPSGNSRGVDVNTSKPKSNKEIHSAVEVQILMNEKKALQMKLRKFEKMFEEVNARKVQFNHDIKGLESDYRRYKYLKTKLQLLREQ